VLASLAARLARSYRCYNFLDTCRPIHTSEDWVSHKIASSFTSETGVGNQKHLNPQFHLRLPTKPSKDTVKVLVSISQTSKRVVKKTAMKETIGIAPLLAGGVTKLNKRVVSINSNMIAETGSYVRAKRVQRSPNDNIKTCPSTAYTCERGKRKDEPENTIKARPSAA
jgi:hypothetical protein